MRALDRDLKCTRGVVVSIAAGVAACLPLVLGTGAAQAALITKCPTPKSLTSAAGTQLTLKQSKAGMDVFCDYTHPLANFKQDSVSISVEPLGESDSAFESSSESTAKALKAPFKKLSGIGDAAWEYTEPKSKIPDTGAPTTTVTILVGKREVTVISNLEAKHVLAVAKRVS